MNVRRFKFGQANPHQKLNHFILNLHLDFVYVQTGKKFSDKIKQILNLVLAGVGG